MSRRALLLLVAAAAAPVAYAQEEEPPPRSCEARDVPSHVDGTPGPDVLTSDPAVVQRVRGFGGDDVLTGGGPYDCLQGGEGNDRVTAAPEGSRLRGGHGADRLTGGPGEDDLRGDQGRDVLEGGAGDDVVDGILVSHIVVRGHHLSGVPYDKERDVLRGGEGNDTLLGGFRDLIDGGPGDDKVWDDGWARRLAGGDGNDEVVSSGADAIDAGPGDDDIRAVDESATARTEEMQEVDCGPGHDRVEANFADELTGCEAVRLDRPAAELSVRPRRGGRRTVFRVSFRAPWTRTGRHGRFYAVDGRAARWACGRRGRRFTARRGERLAVTLRPPRRGWCPGKLSVMLFETRAGFGGIAESYSAGIARVRIAGG